MPHINRIRSKLENSSVDKWIKMEDVYGYSIEKLKSHLKERFFSTQYSEDDIDLPDHTLADYISDCLSSKQCYKDVGIRHYYDALHFLVVVLGSSYTANTIYIDSSSFLDEKKDQLDDLFELLYSDYLSQNDIHVKNLIRVLLCNIFQAGNEWGTSNYYRYNFLNKENRIHLLHVCTTREGTHSEMYSY